MDEPEARSRLTAARVARLATVSADGVPHLVPFVFAMEGDTVWSAVDHKPKRTQALRRLANVAANPSVSVLADHYADDWTALWWVRADGRARVHSPGTPSALHAVGLLAAKYPQHAERPPEGPVLEITVTHVAFWSYA